MSSETIELRGHIIDSLILPKVLDEIMTRGGTFKIGEIRIGAEAGGPKFCSHRGVRAVERELDDIILRLRQHGAAVMERAEVQLAPSPTDGVYPQDFTSRRTSRLSFNWAMARWRSSRL